MTKKLFLFILPLALFACATMNIPNSIGAAYVSIESIAQTIQLECGNTEPGGPCRATSALDRGDVNAMKEDLQLAKNAVDEANRIYNAGDPSAALNSLQLAQTTLAALRATLEFREVVE